MTTENTLGAGSWMPFALTLNSALDRGDDPALLMDENSPLRDELRRLITEGRANAPRSAGPDMRYAHIIKAAINLLAACKEQHDNAPWPQKYCVPYGEVVALQEALTSQPPWQQCSRGRRWTTLSRPTPRSRARA